MSEPVMVFVSHHHSSEEGAFTARLVADRIAAGAEVWVDVVGAGAADFQKRINEALANCNWFVLVLTPAAIAFQWVEMEVHAAIRLKTQGRMRGIIQIMAEPVS
jgi:TIR domain-containing protein